MCEKEFLRIGLSFWTGYFQLEQTYDSHTAASVGDMDMLSEYPQVNWYKNM